MTRSIGPAFASGTPGPNAETQNLIQDLAFISSLTTDSFLSVQHFLTLSIHTDLPRTSRKKSIPGLYKQTSATRLLTSACKDQHQDTRHDHGLHTLAHCIYTLPAHLNTHNEPTIRKTMCGVRSAVFSSSPDCGVAGRCE